MLLGPIDHRTRCTLAVELRLGDQWPQIEAAYDDDAPTWFVRAVEDAITDGKADAWARQELERDADPANQDDAEYHRLQQDGRSL